VDHPIHEARLSLRDSALQSYTDYDGQLHVEYTGGSVPGFFYTHRDHARQISHCLHNQILKVPRQVPEQDPEHPGVKLIDLTSLELVLHVNSKPP